MPKSLSLFDLSPGKKIDGRYLIKRAHRQGGMSAAFEVEDETNHERRELQVFPGGLFEKPAQGDGFLDAMSAWKEVSSVALNRVWEVSRIEDGTVLLVTDFPEGHSMREHLNEHGRADEKTAVRIGLRLLEGLEAAHSADLVHGDIKPYTIHLTEERACLVDGGITPALWNAKSLGEKTQLIGTPYYAPIEQFGGDSPSVKSDIYNLATVLFELVTGTVPWKGKSFLEVFQAKLDKTPISIRAREPELEISEAFDEAIALGMMADRTQRYDTAAEFREKLEHALAG